MILKLLSKFPLSVLYILSDLISFVAHKIVRYRKNVVYENITRCFPDKSTEDIKKIVKGFYRNLSDVIVEIIRSINITKEELKGRIKFNNADMIQRTLEEGKPFIGMTSHQCNWEWILLGFNAHFEFPIDAIYKPLSNKRHDQLIFKMRSRFGGTPIPKSKAVREIVRRGKEPRGFGIVADQLPLQSDDKYWSTFLGRDTAFFVGSDHLARLINAPVYFFALKRVRRGYYESDIIKLTDPPYEKGAYSVIESYARTLEKQIEENPSDWLWSHKRWKYKKAK